MSYRAAIACDAPECGAACVGREDDAPADLAMYLNMNKGWQSVRQGSRWRNYCPGHVLDVGIRAAAHPSKEMNDG